MHFELIPLYLCSSIQYLTQTECISAVLGIQFTESFLVLREINLVSKLDKTGYKISFNANEC